jgi:hypothetical protein
MTTSTHKFVGGAPLVILAACLSGVGAAGQVSTQGHPVQEAWLN